MISPVEFGRSSLFAMVNTVLTIVMPLGLDQAFVRYFNVNDYEKKVLLCSSIMPGLLFCIIPMIGFFLFKSPLSYWLFNQYEPFLLFAFILSLPLLIVQRFGTLIIRMELRGKLYSVLNIIFPLTNFIFFLLLSLFFRGSYKCIVYAAIFSTLLNTIIVICVTGKSWNLRKENINKPLTKDLLQFGLPMLPALVISLSLNSFDKIGLRLWSSFEQLGLYAAAFKISSIVSIIQSIFTTAWIPVAYRWHEKNVSTDKFDSVSIVVLSVISMAVAGITVFRDVIIWILGPEYRDTSVIFVYLLFVPAMFTISETTNLGIAFSKKTIFNLYVYLICFCINILGNYILIPVWGARGAAISTCMSYIVFFWARTLFSRKVWYNFGLIKYIVNIGLLILLLLVVELKLPRYFEIMIFLIIVAENCVLLKKRFKMLAAV
jgi:O-antigen/teichoic acid export membrane protein